jgi:hypothetical protein
VFKLAPRSYVASWQKKSCPSFIASPIPCVLPQGGQINDKRRSETSKQRVHMIQRKWMMGGFPAYFTPRPSHPCQQKRKCLAKLSLLYPLVFYHEACWPLWTLRIQLFTMHRGRTPDLSSTAMLSSVKLPITIKNRYIKQHC